MISVIIPCKNRLNHLTFTFPMVRRMEGEIEIIIVDYNCPMGTADFIEATYAGQAKVVRVDAAPEEWNLARARNLGYKASSGDALLFLDADTKVKSNFLTQHPLPENHFYTGHWLHASGCCMVWRKDFETVHGYNEVCEGWGTEDYDLYRRMEGKGVQRKYFNKQLFENMKHHDRTRNQYHGKKDIHASNEENYQRTLKEFRSCLIESK